VAKPKTQKKSAKPKPKSRVARKASKPSKARPAKRAPAAKVKPKAKRATAATSKRKAPPRVAKVKAAAKPPRARARAKVATLPARRDATGHLSPKYAAGLRALSRQSATSKDAASFVKGAQSRDPLAEELGEDFVKAALSGDDVARGTLDQVVDEENGGPFVETKSKTEFARGTDASNPRSAFREPFPTS
jgi:hypothetical protein